MTSMLAKCSLPMLSLLLGISLGLPPAARAGSPLSNDPSPLAVCQDSIRTAGLRLATDARRVLSACFTAGIECVAGATGTRADCCEDAARRCRGRLPKLERAIRRFATFVENRRCRVVPFADLVTPDGLGYGALADVCGGMEPRRAADDLTGLVECLAAVVVEDAACGLGLRELPRSADALACMAIEELDLSSCAAPSAATPTPTPAVSATPTEVSTTVPTTTSLRTSTPIVTAVGTVTPLPSATPSPTATVTGTPLAPATATGTSLATATPIRTVTPTSGPTASSIVTPTTVPTAAATTTPIVAPTATTTPVRTVTPVPTVTVVPTVTAAPTTTATLTATTTPVRTVTPVPTVTIVPTVTAAPTTTATLTAVPTVTATRTPTPVVTSTPSGPVCGNRVVEAGEACDDGNTVGCDDCPKNCQANTAPVACSATTVRHAQRVRLQAPTGAVLSGGQICLDYPTGVVALPGTGNVAGRSSNLAGLVTLNDFNNAVQLTFVANPGAAQVNPTISFDLCTGQTAPIPSAFECVVKGASNQGTAIDPALVQCTPITIP